MLSATPAIKVLLIDDHCLFRNGLHALLAATAGFVVVGETASCEEAAAMLPRLRPDVIVVDAGGRGQAGDAVTRLRDRARGAKVVVLSTYDALDTVQETLNAGAAAWVHKRTSTRELVRSLRTVVRSEGRPVLLGSPPTRPVAGTEPCPLSDREVEVLTLVARARSNRQIGAELAITEGTVKRHLRNIYTKLGAVSRIDAVNKAIAAALLPRPVNGPDAPGAPRPGIRRGRPVPPR